MTLKEFTTTTLSEIVEAVQETNQKISKSTSFIPASSIKNLRENDTICDSIDNDGNIHLVTMVEFDVAIAVSREDECSKNGSAKLAVFSVAGNSESTELMKSVSRVKFSLPLALPFNDKE